MDVLEEVFRAKCFKQRFRRYKHALLARVYKGDKRYCPLCGKYSGKFLDYGATRRKDAECMHCGSLERHRLLWVFLNKKTDFISPRGRRVLHVAPEPCLGKKLKEIYLKNYLSSDINPNAAMEVMDITDIDYDQDYFDIIFCSHVLEHIPDDRRAIKELYRVLKPGGWAIVLVPIEGDYTREDLTIDNPEVRSKLYGQPDHVRAYGVRDYTNLLVRSGFDVSIYYPKNILDCSEIEKMGLTSNAGEIFFCEKRKA